MYYLLVSEHQTRDDVLRRLNARGINAIFHYAPLHSSTAGVKYGRAHGDLKVTEDVSKRIIRLPMWIGLTRENVDEIASAVESFLAAAPRR